MGAGRLGVGGGVGQWAGGELLGRVSPWLVPEAVQVLWELLCDAPADCVGVRWALTPNLPTNKR